VIKGKAVYYYMGLGIAVTAVLFLNVAHFFVFWQDCFWINETVRTAAETAGALIAIAVAFLLLQRSFENKKPSYFILANGFIVMGILDGFHTLATLGNRFVWLHSIATLSGGLIFIVVWSEKLSKLLSRRRWIFWFSALFSFTLGAQAYLFPEYLPGMIENARFTPLATVINVSAGILFLLSAIYFLRIFYRFKKTEAYWFAFLFTLFGMAGISFQYSEVWCLEWWVWHLIRLIAFLLLLRMMILEYRLKSIRVRKRNRKLQELDERKTMFVSHVSHEFRNPLMIARESINMILEGVHGELNSDQKKLLGYTQNSIERLTRMVVNILDISKIEAGNMEINRTKFKVESLLNEVIAINRREITKKLIVYEQDVREDVGFILADRDKLSEIIINVLNNAVRYTPDEGKINISVTGTDGDVRFEVSDSNPQIADEDQDSVFDKYERVSSGSKEGAGLDLPIARELVILHGGTIWIENIEGVGNKIIFILPRR
jgi:signal transduction histidine kinase